MTDHFAKQKFSSTLFSNKIFCRNKKIGEDACEILAHAIYAVDPYVSVSNMINLHEHHLNFNTKVIDLNNIDRIYVIGFGKASVPMAQALLDKLGKKINDAMVITKDEKFLSVAKDYDNFTILIGGHPIPNQDSVKSTQIMLNSLPEFTEKDFVFVLVSGGGSALFTKPVQGVSLEDLQFLTQSLLQCGAGIYEINTLRKHLDLVKGGRLAQRLQPAVVETIILSDVIGDRLDVIASGPTVPDPTTYKDAIEVLQRYKIFDRVPLGIIRSLEQGYAGDFPETLKPENPHNILIDYHLIGSNLIAAKAARGYAEKCGYQAKVLTTEITERTDQVADYLQTKIDAELKTGSPLAKPLCLIFGGEPTVLVTGDGLGGRNMDLALRMVSKIAGKEGILFTSFATDGEDGPTDAAGAVIDGNVYDEAVNVLGLSLEDTIKDSNSYHFFEKIGGLIKTGATGTNVNDLILILIDLD